MGVTPLIARSIANSKTKQGLSHYSQDQLPHVVQIQESSDQLSDRAETAKERKEAEKNNRFIMFFTGGTMLVGLFQLGVFLWQLRLLRKSVISTQLAATAADLNARAAVGIELPILRIIPTDLVGTDRLIDDSSPYGGFVNDGPPTRYSAIGHIIVRNHGRTPAFPEEIAVGWMVANALPEIPTYKKRSRMNHGAVVEPNKEFLLDQHYGIELSNADVESAKSGNAWLWFFGIISYTDFLQSKRESRFCWRFANRNFDNVFYAFMSDGNPPASYLPVGPSAPCTYNSRL